MIKRNSAKYYAWRFFLIHRKLLWIKKALHARCAPRGEVDNRFAIPLGRGESAELILFCIIGNSHNVKALRANDAQLRARNKSCAIQEIRTRECAKHTFVLVQELVQ